MLFSVEINQKTKTLLSIFMKTIVCDAGCLEMTSGCWSKTTSSIGDKEKIIKPAVTILR